MGLLDTLKNFFRRKTQPSTLPSPKVETAGAYDQLGLDVANGRYSRPGSQIDMNNLPSEIDPSMASTIYKQRKQSPTPSPTMSPSPRASASPMGGRPDDRGITFDRFIKSISGQESGGNYGATNNRTAASGKYQILPSNWSSWAKEAGLGASAPQTPVNQERVARHKFQQLYNQYGNWADVASVWYSGQPYGARNPNVKQGPTSQEPSINEYVSSVLRRAK